MGDRRMRLENADGEVVELAVEGSTLVFERWRSGAIGERRAIAYDDLDDLERAFRARLRTLTTDGFAGKQAAVAAPSPPAHDVIPVALARGLGPFSARGYDAYELSYGRAARNALERDVIVVKLQSGLGLDALVPEMHRWVVAHGVRTVAFDADPHRLLEQFSATQTSDHLGLLRSWLAAVAAEPGDVRELAFSACALERLEPAFLAEHLRPFESLAFVGCAPPSFACAAKADRMTLGYSRPSGVVEGAALRGLGATGSDARSLRLETMPPSGVHGTPADEMRSGLRALFAGKGVPRLIDLTVSSRLLSGSAALLIGTPVMIGLRRLRVDAVISDVDLQWLADRRDAFAHLERVEVRPLVGSVEPARIEAEAPWTHVLRDAIPVCPF